MNWGYKITFLYLGFVALILVLVFTSMRNKEDLVAKDYYLQELKYQERMNEMKNANEMEEAIAYTVSGKQVILEYPVSFLGGDFNGEISFYRPSNASMDFKVEMMPGENRVQQVGPGKFSRGMYRMRFLWQMEGKKYFKEEIIFIR